MIHLRDGDSHGGAAIQIPRSLGVATWQVFQNCKLMFSIEPNFGKKEKVRYAAIACLPNPDCVELLAPIAEHFGRSTFGVTTGVASALAVSLALSFP